MKQTDLVPSSLSPPLFAIDRRRLRRNVNRRRKRVCDSVEELNESVSCAVGDIWSNLSKNVLLRFIDIRVVSGVGIDDEDEDELGNAILGKTIGLDFVRVEIIWNGWIVVEVDDNVEMDLGDKAKYTVSVVMKVMMMMMMIMPKWKRSSKENKSGNRRRPSTRSERQQQQQ